MDAELERMVRELHDKQSIHEVIVNYARGVDRQDRELLLSCYHPEAIDDHGLFVGEASDFFDWTEPSHLYLFRSHHHVVANHFCTIDGDTAHCETYYLFAGMTKDGDQLALSGGRYIDRMEKRDGQWRIAARKCVVEWGSEGMNSPEGQQVSAAVGRMAKDKSDLSYDRPLAIDRTRVGIRTYM